MVWLRRKYFWPRGCFTLRARGLYSGFVVSGDVITALMTRRTVSAVAWTLLGCAGVGAGAQGTRAVLPPLEMAAAAPAETQVFPLSKIHRGAAGGGLHGF